MEVENFNEPEITEEVLNTQEIKGSPKKKKPKKEPETSIAREILSWVLSFAVALLATVILKDYVIINANVPTGSMENTIMPGDRLIGNRLAYLWSEPERGDIVIFHYPDNENELYVKRIIGLPGETVVIEDGKIYINGAEEPLEEPYLKETWTNRTGPYYFEVPEGSYLMLGDNRNDSLDARYWNNTYVKKEKILGKAVVVYWPIQNFGKLE
ncbi:MAG: signal peptidase I [Roseburia sp.]|nr:signal peptidase I [Roseburia sp.]